MNNKKNLIYNHYIELISKSFPITMYSLSIICRAIEIFDLEIALKDGNNKVKDEDLVDYAFKLCLNT